jgi:hypothetical protein
MDTVRRNGFSLIRKPLAFPPAAPGIEFASHEIFDPGAFGHRGIIPLPSKPCQSSRNGIRLLYSAPIHPCFSVVSISSTFKLLGARKKAISLPRNASPGSGGTMNLAPLSFKAGT